MHLSPEWPAASSALRLCDLQVNRQSRSRHTKGQAYHVANALADTGAVVSIVTTGMLALLPSAAVQRRLRRCEAHPAPLTGANGELLIQQGTAAITFHK